MKTFKEFISEASVEPISIPEVADKVYDITKELGGDPKYFDIEKNTKNYNTFYKVLVKLGTASKWDKNDEGLWTYKPSSMFDKISYEELEKTRGTKSIMKYFSTKTKEFNENEKLSDLKREDIIEYFSDNPKINPFTGKELEGAEAHLLGSNFYSTIEGIKLNTDAKYLSLESTSFLSNVLGLPRAFRAGIRFPYGWENGEIWSSYGKSSSFKNGTPKKVLKMILDLEREAEKAKDKFNKEMKKGLK
jgi:hypothetical protein